MTTFGDILLRLLITLYGITGLCNFYASRPQMDKDDEELFHTGHNSYAFRIITSLIFFYYGISEFKSTNLIYLTFVEIAVIIIIYMRLLFLEHKHTKRYKSRLNPKKKI